MILRSRRAIARVALSLLALFCAAPAGAAPEKADGGIRFTYTNPNAQAVFWAGDHNGWNATATPMTRGANGAWSVTIPLGAGEHAYKFVVDGQWFADPENPVTAGEFGNSVVRVNERGELVAMAATSNTPYSPKIFLSGRIIGTYVAIENRANDRFELRRPNMDVDLGFDTRISDALRARWLMNIQSETEDVEFFRSRLNFDRGALEVTRPDFQIFAYDNEDAGTWDDPFRLVGAVGIYDHAYGYDRQGFRASTGVFGFESQLHYADNFRTGGTTFPASNPDHAALAANLPVMPDGAGGYALLPFRGFGANQINSDANEDMVAFRTKRAIRPDLTLGVMARSDRGYEPTGLTYTEIVGPKQVRVRSGSAEGEWYALGADGEWRDPARNLRVFAGYLRGQERLTLIRANDQDAVTAEFSVTTDSAGVTGIDGPIAFSSANGFHLDTESSDRFRLGAEWTLAGGDVGLRGDVEFLGMNPELGRADRSMTVWRLGWDRNWRHYLGREVRTGFDVEYTAFDYDAGATWADQLWFPDGNFWLEHGEHEVGVDRLVMLGGNDAMRVMPRLFVPIHDGRRATFEYRGTFGTVALDKNPKYVESLFKLGVDLTTDLRLSTDTRWVKYDDPVLGLHRGYVNHFAEVAYRFAPTIQIALSVGVDPWVIDAPVNRYAYIGRDQFLFARGATGDRARSNYFSLGTFDGTPGFIDQAERALEKERRVQLEAIVHF